MKCSSLLLSLLVIGCSRDVALPNKVLAQHLDGCALSSWVLQQPAHSTRTLEAPPPVLRDTILTVNGSSHKISIPAGFTMSVFAKIPQCRGLACSPDGVLYATSYNGNIYALPDHNHDGLPDSTIVIFSGLGNPHGIGFYNEELYVSNNAGIYRLNRKDSTRVIGNKTTIAALPPAGGHYSRNFVVDSTKNKFYVQIGSNGNMDTTDFARRAQVVEMNTDGTGYRTFARGLRNAVGMDLDPRTGALWVNNNGMDDIFGSGTKLTADNPSECVYLLCDGANYGWPYCYGFQVRNPVQPWVKLDTNIVKTFDGPVAEVLAHEAPLGLHFYRGTAFPSLYHNAIFQCYHGSWDRTPPAPPRITVMWADTDGRNARVTDFVNGFQPDSSSNRWSRPVSIIEGTDSALYVSDDAVGTIFRIRWTGASETGAVPDGASTPSRTISLGDIVPDPADITIRVELNVGTVSFVHADILDLAGRTVVTVYNDEMSAGPHSISANTSHLPNGSYTLRVAAGDEVITKRLVVKR